MVRTFINLAKSDKAWLDHVARKRGVTASALVREAVADFRKKTEQSPDDFSRLQAAVVGTWKHGKSEAYVRRLRTEWDR